MTYEWDALVIGGGPAGSTAAAMLARKGQRVLVLEREKFPRFHVGESLIPWGNDVLRDLGFWDKLESAGFMPKGGAEFALGNAAGSQRFYFARTLPQGYKKTFQVERAKFDHLLLDHAREFGAEVREQAKVADLSADENGAQISYDWNGERHETSARWLIDASGRTALAGNAFGIPKSDLGLPKRIAIFGHFRGVFRNGGEEAGHITVARMEHAWIWFIPLDAERTSVGLVQTLEDFKAQHRSPEESFQRVIEQHAEPRFRMTNAERVSSLYSEGEYTFRFATAAGSRWLLTGDAAGFIDPIFSSGVMVALNSGARAAKAILRAGSRPLTRSQQRSYTRYIFGMTEAFLGMIRMFYDREAFEVFMARSPFAGLLQSVVQLVGGNTTLPWKLRWYLKVFYGMCRLQRHYALVPRLSFTESPNQAAPLKKPLAEASV